MGDTGGHRWRGQTENNHPEHPNHRHAYDTTSEKVDADNFNWRNRSEYSKIKSRDSMGPAAHLTPQQGPAIPCGDHTIRFGEKTDRNSAKVLDLP